MSDSEKNKVDKVVFLDFDGVITTRKNGFRLEPELMDKVKKICDETGAKIVVSSSWRKSSLEGTINDLRKNMKHNLFSEEYIIDVTDYVTVSKYSGPGSDDCSVLAFRGLEIEKWLEDNYNVKSYVILDDESDMLYPQRYNFIHTDLANGITDKDVETAISILMEEDIPDRKYRNNIPNTIVMLSSKDEYREAIKLAIDLGAEYIPSPHNYIDNEEKTSFMKFEFYPEDESLEVSYGNLYDFEQYKKRSRNWQIIDIKRFKKQVKDYLTYNGND